MTYPAAPKKSGGALKWILLGCGGLIFLAVAFFAVTGYLVYRGMNTDPAKVETSAKEIMAFQKPEGFNGVFSMSMMGLKMAMFMKTPGDESNGSLMIGSFPSGGQSREQFQAQIQQNMKQQGHSAEITEKRPAETFKVRGQDVTADVGLVSPKDAEVKVIQYTLTVDAASGKMGMIMISGPEKTFDHAWVQKFLDTVK